MSWISRMRELSGEFKQVESHTWVRCPRCIALGREIDSLGGCHWCGVVPPSRDGYVTEAKAVAYAFLRESRP